MLERVISGGQTGADQAAWRAAEAAGIPTGGAMPRGFFTEEGPRPDFAAEFGAYELDRHDYDAAAEANTREADGTLWISDSGSPKGELTLEWCWNISKTSTVLVLGGSPFRPGVIARWISELNIRVLMVAGDTESNAPGIGLRVEAFLARVFPDHPADHSGWIPEAKC